MRSDAFLANARRMLAQSENKPDQCTSRAIIHASYYAVYHLCSDALGLDPSVKGQAHHTAVGDQVRKSDLPNPILQAAKTTYETMRVSRVMADYKLNHPTSAREAILAVSRALRIFNAAKITPTTE